MCDLRRRIDVAPGPRSICSISLGEGGLGLFRLSRWLRNHPQSVAIQDINEISFVLEPLDYSCELLHDSGGRRIGQILKYKIIIRRRAAAPHREHLTFSDDGQVSCHVQPAGNGWIVP